MNTLTLMKDALRFLILHEIQSLSTDSINDVEGGTYEIEFTTYEELSHKYFPYIPLLDKAKAALFDDDWTYFISEQADKCFVYFNLNDEGFEATFDFESAAECGREDTYGI